MSSSAQLLLLKGAISELTEVEQKQVANAKEAIKQTIEQHGDPGLIALTWLAIELGDA